MLNLTELRQNRGWSKSELARRARVNAGTLSLVESGRLKPYPAQLAKIARALGVPTEAADGLLRETSHE